MKVLVIGAGSFGSTAAVELAARKCEVIVMDTVAAKLEGIRDKVAQVIVGDGTDNEVLSKFAKNMDVILVSLGEVIEASVLAVLRLKELDAKRIIAKATSGDHEKILKKIGAHQIVNPERDEAIRLASYLVSPNIIDLMELSQDVNLIEAGVPEAFFGKTLRELELRKKYGLHVLAVKNPLHAKAQVMPHPNYRFEADDIMIVIGDTANLTETLKRKV